MLTMCSPNGTYGGWSSWWAVQDWPLSVERWEGDSGKGWIVFAITDTKEISSHHRQPYDVTEKQIKEWLVRNNFLLPDIPHETNFVFFPTRGRALDAVEMALLNDPPSWTKRGVAC